MIPVAPQLGRTGSRHGIDGDAVGGRVTDGGSENGGRVVIGGNVYGGRVTGGGVTGGVDVGACESHVTRSTHRGSVAAVGGAVAPAGHAPCEHEFPSLQQNSDVTRSGVPGLG